jgi:Secretory lipase
MLLINLKQVALLAILSISVRVGAAPAKGLPEQVSARQSSPVPPSKDPFYTPPEGYEQAAAGEVLRFRLSPNPVAALSRAKLNISASYQFLYRTADSHGNPEAAVTTLIIPQNADPTKLLSYQVFEDAAFIDCAPSISFQYKTKAENIATQIEVLLITAALERGWYVNSPDYEGPKAAFTAGTQAGQATLDSIRAVLSSGATTNLSSSATTGLWGYSGGSLASGWAVQLQPSYAPELKFVGAALGGTVPNIGGVLNRINNGPFVGLAFAGIIGLTREYPELATFIDQHLLPKKKKDFERAASQCLPADIVDYVADDVFDYVDSPDILTEPVPSQIIVENSMGAATPNTPLYIYKSTKDEVSPINDTDLLVSNWCSEGVQIEYVRDKLSEHVVLIATGAAEAILWLDDRMGGVAAQPGCSNTTVESSLANSRALKAFGSVILDDLKALAGKPVRPLSIT